MTPETLIEKVSQYLPPEKVTLIREAYEFAACAHEGQVRKSGTPYVEHPLEIAVILSDLQLDAATIVAALLHDVPEDCQIPITKIEEKFGAEVARLVEGVTKLSKVSWHKAVDIREKSQSENLRKMLMAMAQDLRVVFIKLADRLHNMRTLDALSPEKRKGVAHETLDIYAPLAHRLGIWEVKWQLEDLAFRHIEPKKYHDIAHMITGRRTQREDFIQDVVQIAQKEMEKSGIKAEVSGRPKHIYSIHNKIRKYAALGKSFDDIHDLFALRILVDTVQDCYKALGTIHTLWHPLPDEFNDYIANPKDNGYQSLHTTVLAKSNTPLEVQIRTYEMHYVADYGVAAHWRYKETGKEDKRFEDKIAWLRQLIEWQNEVDSDHFLESIKTDFFNDQVFIYTPNGEIKALPIGATPLDFAYRIHTELGHRCIGTKVNGKLVPLNHTLKNGDIVEIMTTKADRGPSLDWLNQDLGYVKTSHALEKIRSWFKKQERTKNIERGRQILEKETKRLGIAMPDIAEIIELFHYDNYDDFLAAIGYGGITQHSIAVKLNKEQESSPIPGKALPSHKTTASGIEVLGVGDLLTQLAACCNPLPGDEIIGYITRSRGVSIHRKKCTNIVNLKEKERLIEVNWGKVVDVYPITIQIEAFDRMGLLRDITTIVAENKINISGINLIEHSDGVTIFATLEVKDMGQLNYILAKIHTVRGVNSAERINSQIKSSVNT
jgi:GTP diphosphokinase / guanosine-3',5'-bis(diphosphate) 3'-diphosphatase